MKKVIKVLAFLSFILMMNSAQAELSRQAQIDIKQKEIIQSFNSENYQAAYQQFKEYDAFSVKTKLPLPLQLVRATVSYQVKDYIASKAFLEGYINNAERGTDDYNDALSLYLKVAPKLEAQKSEQQQLSVGLTNINAKKKIQAARQRVDARVAVLQGVRFFLPEMVDIPAGSFAMGSGEEMNEQPVHTVDIPAFKVSKFETTQALWQSIMGYNPSAFKGKRRPVERISWNDIQEFLLILNKVTGKQFRLLTEAEWEYAARAGSTTKYSWGNRASKRKANFAASRRRGTKPVGSYKPNDFGLYDMHGNVWEWVQDCFNEAGYGDAPVNGMARESCDTQDRVARGGSWSSKAYHTRSAYRFKYLATFKFHNFGFRLALDN